MTSLQLTEIWIWYGIAIVSVACRYILKQVLTKSWLLKPDDWLTLVIMCFFTASLIIDTEAVVWSDNVAENGERSERDSITTLRLFTILYDHFTLVVLWLCKAALLVAFWRESRKRGETLMVKLIAIFVAASYVFIIIAYACVWCRPPSNYLAVKPSYDECQRPEGHLISVAALEIFTNFLLLALAIPLLFQAGFRSLRNFPVSLLAVFVLATIIITIINRVLAVTDDFHQLFTWYIRECALAIIVVNLAAISHYRRYRADGERSKVASEPGKTSSWRRSWRPAPKQASKDIMEITSGSALWKDVTPGNTPSQGASRPDSRDAKELIVEMAKSRAESPIDRPHLGTISSMSASSWLHIDGD